MYVLQKTPLRNKKASHRLGENMCNKKKTNNPVKKDKRDVNRHIKKKMIYG